MPVGDIFKGIVGNLTGSTAADAAKNASQAQLAGIDKAIGAELYMYGQGRSDLSPYRQVGKRALYSLADMYGVGGQKGQQAFSNSALQQFQRSPDYKVALKTGMQGLNSQGAATGQLLSGAQLRRGQELGADIGSRYFGSYLDRLSGLAETGQNSAARSATNAMTAGSSIAGLENAGGIAQGAGILGAANATNSAYGNLIGAGFSGLSAYSGSNALGNMSNFFGGQ